MAIMIKSLLQGKTHGMQEYHDINEADHNMVHMINMINMINMIHMVHITRLTKNDAPVVMKKYRY